MGKLCDHHVIDVLILSVSMKKSGASIVISSDSVYVLFSIKNNVNKCIESLFLVQHIQPTHNYSHIHI